MKNFMKFAVPVTMALTLFAGATASAECRGALTKKIAAYKQDNVFVSVVTGVTGGVGAAVMPPAGLAATTLAGGALSIGLNKLEQAKLALNLINEAELGDGLLLRELAKEKNIDITILAKTIVEANEMKILCADDQNVYGYQEISAFIGTIVN